jgi:sarcosine oxidase
MIRWMPGERSDVIVVGLGAMGAALAWRLARRGVRVVGLDRFHPPHVLGSTHGRSRIIREAYYEHPHYVPLVQRAFSLWSELEAESRTRLYQPTGGLMIGAEDGPLVSGARTSADRHGVPVQVWTREELARRVPALTPPSDAIALFEPRAGVLDPERAVSALLSQAAALGADLRFDTPVTALEIAGDRVLVRTDNGERFEAGRLILAAGGWLPTLVPDLALPLLVERAVQYWFPTGGQRRYGPEALPIFLLEAPDGRMLYGLPDQGHGLKLAEHHSGETTTADAVRREVAPHEADRFVEFAAPFVPGLQAPSATAVCLYTNTPDEHFILDRHPKHERVFLVSACSGHGFKFAPVIGELVADELAGQTPLADLAPFRLSRFARV